MRQTVELRDLDDPISFDIWSEKSCVDEKNILHKYV